MTHIAVRPSMKSWFGLLGVFIVVFGSPVALVTSRHSVSAFTASGLLRYAVLPSSDRSLPPNCSTSGWNICISQRGLWYGKSNAFCTVRLPCTFLSLGPSAIMSFQVFGASFTVLKPAASNALFERNRLIELPWYGRA